MLRYDFFMRFYSIAHFNQSHTSLLNLNSMANQRHSDECFCSLQALASLA